jgi:hypothetical protein
MMYLVLKEVTPLENIEGLAERLEEFGVKLVSGNVDRLLLEKEAANVLDHLVSADKHIVVLKLVPAHVHGRISKKA